MERTEVELIHDLRMPLQLIQSSAQLIRMSLDDPSADAGRYVDMLLESVGQMQRMLNGAMESCGRAIRPDAPCLRDGDVVAVVRGICRRCRDYARSRGVELTASGNVGALAMALDEDKLSRILLNLISNALRATPGGGRVGVTWTAMGDWIEIAVADTGRGIAPERLPYVFLDGETGGGHGCGLSIAGTYARMLGGELSAASEPGRGSVFTLRLPVRSALAS